MNMPLVLLNRRRRGGSFSPYSLFSGTAIGTWFDPSDVANLTWRRNLLTYSEQFDNAAWPKANLTVAANASTSPLGTTSADRATSTAVTGATFAVQFYTPAASAAHVFSVYLKAGTQSFVQLLNTGDAQAFVNFNISTGAVGTSGTKTTGAITSVGDGWFRCEARFNSAVVWDVGFRISFSPSASATFSAGAFVGTGAENFLLWGAQLELGTSATDYQRISDVNTEVIERFPNATMYQDAAGTTPVTTPGQPVGLRLDKSKRLVLGAELSPGGGTFDSSTGWTINGTTMAISGGVLTVSAGAAEIYPTDLTKVKVGRSYRVSFTVSNSTANYGVRVLNKGTNTGSYFPALYPFDYIMTNGSYNIVIVAQFDGSIGLNRVASHTGSLTIDDFSVKELPGNHATQSVLASRPVYGIEPAGGRRNLLTFSEDQTNAAWVKTRSSISANSTAAPDGTLTADKLVEDTTAANNHTSYQIIGSNPIGTYTASVYAKAGERSQIQFAQTITTGRFAEFNLSTGTVIGTPTNCTASIVAAGSGWYRCSITYTTAVVQDLTNVIYLINGGTVVYTGDGVSGAFLWGAQLELGSTATAYQRVTTAYDVTEAGVQSCHYVQYDGSDDGMVTNSIDFTATDKMSVFAGVWKRSDASRGTVLSIGTTFTNGMRLEAPSLTPPGTTGYMFVYAGTNSGSATNFNAPAPTTNVLTGVADIAAPSLTVRNNGSLFSTLSDPTGGGNFSLGPINIGRRWDSTIFFNGRDYGIVVVGKATTADEITSTERWLSGKTGFYAPVITGVPTIGVS